MVCFIHRPEYYKIYEDEKGNDLRGLAEIIIAKHRSGSVGDVRLKFRGELVRFQNLDEDTSLTNVMTQWSGQGNELGSRMNNDTAPDFSQQPNDFGQMMPPTSGFGAPTDDSQPF